MARPRHEEPDEEEDDWDDGDDYDPADPETYPSGLYDDDGPPTVLCPHCRAEILEDSEQCPKCGEYISKEDAPSNGMSGVAWAVVLLMILAIVLSIVGGG
ncbi:MAG: zinc ribbon domain-containing protein [Planctomycetes bacterium]|nr:zinc ribbon domain-containing protein [Planctomycetota bacterium]